MSPKRVLIAATIFVTLFGGFTAVAGLDKEPASELPTSFSMPERHVGDRGTYMVFHVEGDDTYGPFPYMDWEVEPTATRHDRTGTPYAANQLRVAEGGWHMDRDNDGWRFGWDYTWRLALAMDDGGLVALDLVLNELLSPFAENGSVDGLGLIQQRASGDGYASATVFLDRSEYPLDFWDPCLLDHLAMGTTFDPSKPFPLFDACTMHGSPVRDTDFIPGLDTQDIRGLPDGDQQRYQGTASFRAIGTTEAGALVAERQDGTRTMRVWLDPATPYPTQVMWQGADEPDNWDIMVLSDLHLGDRAFTQPRPAAPIDVDLAVFPGAVYGLSEAGLEHPFTPSEALQVALQREDIATWFDDHPDARLTDLSGGRSSITAANDEIYWWFHFAAPDGHASFKVDREMDPASQTTALVPEQEQVFGVPVSLVDLDDEPSTDPAVTAPLAPAPSARDALAMFDAFAGAPDGHPTWSLKLRCIEESGDDCDLARWEVLAGRGEVAIDAFVDPEPAVGTTGTVISQALWLNVDDLQPDMLWQVDYTETVTTAPGQADPPTTAVVPQDAEVQWDTPSAAALAGTGLLAALAAGLYLLWPTLKGASLGLFSRIQGAQSLEHPVRAQLAQAIGAEPGVHFQDLARLTGAGRGATEHHLRKLVQTGQVLRHDAGGYVCFFPKKTDRRIMAAAPALRSATARQALQTIMARPGIHGGDLAAALDVNRGTVSHHLKRLQEAGVVAATRTGRTVAYEVTDIGRKVAAGTIAA